MPIGTAAPTKDELKQAKHNFIHNLSIKDGYSVGAFEQQAISCLAKLYKTHDVVILVGGSGLYTDAVVNGLDEFPSVDPIIRERLNESLNSEGIVFLQEKLKVLDRESYDKISIDNPHRIIRALEICIGTGKPYSSFLGIKKQSRGFETITIGLNAERSIIYERINQRVDIMINMGLLNEVQNLIPFRHLNALNTVGYKELFLYFDGVTDLDSAIAEIKKNSRRFAKRQLTWYRKNSDIKWFDYTNPAQSVIKFLNGKM